MTFTFSVRERSFKMLNSEAGFLNNFFHESCNFQIKVATLKFLGFLNKAISSEGFNFVAACLNGFFKHFFTP